MARYEDRGRRRAWIPYPRTAYDALFEIVVNIWLGFLMLPALFASELGANLFFGALILGNTARLKWLVNRNKRENSAT